MIRTSFYRLAFDSVEDRVLREELSTIRRFAGGCIPEFEDTAYSQTLDALIGGHEVRADLLDSLEACFVLLVERLRENYDDSKDDLQRDTMRTRSHLVERVSTELYASRLAADNPDFEIVA